jgi:hypothetical protein
VLQDLIDRGRIQPGFNVEDGIVAIFGTVLVQTNDGEHIVHVIGIEHRVTIPDLFYGGWSMT